MWWALVTASGNRVAFSGDDGDSCLVDDVNGATGNPVLHGRLRSTSYHPPGPVLPLCTPQHTR
ncbi:hypothetical protein FA13DRAFT_1734243 [Coprinellus micaceus]|uniref:Uncharacterized protein n=1 Tax=Coprinellus micaceus TaxID=71717 RepID=A0A4Y7T6T6_COPMI|nr:hypothetical protein FA13DRAFT_1734243 [Coprinellus micaceus]